MKKIKKTAAWQTMLGRKERTRPQTPVHYY